MAGAVANFFRKVCSTREGVVNLISVMSFPILGYIYVDQEKQYAWLEEQERLAKARYDNLKARGMIREK